MTGADTGWVPRASSFLRVCHGSQALGAQCCGLEPPGPLCHRQKSRPAIISSSANMADVLPPPASSRLPPSPLSLPEKSRVRLFPKLFSLNWGSRDPSFSATSALRTLCALSSDRLVAAGGTPPMSSPRTERPNGRGAPLEREALREGRGSRLLWPPPQTPHWSRPQTS